MRPGKRISCRKHAALRTSSAPGIRFQSSRLNFQVTANPLYTAITANFGLGESVVSASAEPDTFVLRKNRNDEYDVEDIKVGISELRREPRRSTQQYFPIHHLKPSRSGPNPKLSWWMLEAERRQKSCPRLKRRNPASTKVLRNVSPW